MFSGFMYVSHRVLNVGLKRYYPNSGESNGKNMENEIESGILWGRIAIVGA